MKQGRLRCVSQLVADFVAEVGDPAVRHWRVVLRRLLIIRSFGALVGGLRLDGGNEPLGFLRGEEALAIEVAGPGKTSRGAHSTCGPG